MQDQLLGRLAVSQRLVTAEELQRCLRLQEADRPRRHLGEILLDEGSLDEEALAGLLSAQRRALDPEAAGVEAHTTHQTTLPEYLQIQVGLNAQHLHLVPGGRAFVRMGGSLVDLTPDPLASDACARLIESALSSEQREALARDRSLHTVVEGRFGRFRLTAFYQTRGLSAVFTRIPTEFPPLADLALPSVVRDLPRLQQGLVLVTGSRGSGKSTTLASLVQFINEGWHRHVVTIEQPIEYRFESAASIVTQHEVGVDTPDFGAALRRTLREDPDVIVIGQLSDPGRIATALTAAETGQLVLGAMETSSAQRTLLRILDASPAARRDHVRAMLASFLRLVISQQLVPGLRPGALHLAAEVLVGTPAVATMIREDRIHQIEQAMRTGRSQGMRLLDDALLELVRGRKISLGEALGRAQNPHVLVPPYLG